MTYRFTTTAPAIRNPLVAPCMRRKAGSHRRSAGGQRLRLNQALRREWQHERQPDT